MSIVLFDNNQRIKLYPLNAACAVADLRVGILTFRERWEHISKEQVFTHTADYLSVLYEPIPEGSHLWIEANFIPDEYTLQRIFSLKENEALVDGNDLIAARKNIAKENFTSSVSDNLFDNIYEVKAGKRFEYPWQIFQWNNEMLREDFARVTAGRESASLPEGNNASDVDNIFLEEGANVYYSTINAGTGPVYIGKNATVMEGCSIRGPFALCDNATLKMGSKVYGASTIGPCCVAGGEIKNVVMQGYSNKAHDGYLGDSVIGKWCNLGAGTSNSNMKNTATVVRMWSRLANDYVPVDLKCGVVMGDYSRTAINSSINTGTVIGVCCNVFGEGLLPKYISDFQWGTKGITKYEFNKSLSDISNWKKMKGAKLTEEEKKVLQYIFENS